jgi:uncharacterized coiled-coil protein SlyX
MLIGATSLISEALTLVAFVFVLAGAGATIFVFLSHRAQSNSTLQASTIAALEGTVTSLEADRALQADQIKALQEKGVRDTERISSLEEQLDLLTALNTQQANVSALRGEMANAFKGVNGKLDVLIGGPR